MKVKENSLTNLIFVINFHYWRNKMSFCKFSTESIANNKIEIDNLFFENFLPGAPDDCVKVYLYGYYLAKNNLEIDNTFEKVAQKLNMSDLDLETAFRYWEEQGLVQVLSTYPIQVLYKPLKDIINGSRLYKPEKYEVFNTQAQELFKGKREISKTEYGEYYDFLETSHMQQEALLMIINYCVENKQKAVGYHYILTVAKNWAKDGILTASQVEEKLMQMEQASSSLGEILKALGLKRNAFIEEREMYRKWTDGMGFEDDAILYVAKNMKKKGGFERLNGMLEKYFLSGKMSVSEIKHYNETKDATFALAKQINKNLGVYYESLDSEIENYILPWLEMGFEEEALLSLATYAFKSSIRSLEGLNGLIQKLFKLGILTMVALDQYLAQISEEDKKVKKILEMLNISRKVNSFDRESYKNWTLNWKMSDEIIEYAASLSNDKLSPLPYMARLLASWHEKGIQTKEEAQKFAPAATVAKPLPKSEVKGRSYSKEDYQAMIQSIDEIEL